MFLLFPSSCGVVFLFLFFFISGCVLGQFILFEALVYWPQKKELPSDIIFSKLCKLLHESYLLSFSCTLLWYWVSNKRKSFLIKEAIRNFLNKQSFFSSRCKEFLFVAVSHVSPGVTHARNIHYLVHEMGSAPVREQKTETLKTKWNRMRVQSKIISGVI